VLEEEGSGRCCKTKKRTIAVAKRGAKGGGSHSTYGTKKPGGDVLPGNGGGTIDERSQIEFEGEKEKA